MEHLPLYSSVHASVNLPGYAAVDTETTRFDEPTYGWKGRTRIRPFGGHDLILGSVAADGFVHVFHREALLDHLHYLLRARYHLIFHNAAFDVPVLQRAGPQHLTNELHLAVNEGRIHDTKILEPLIQIAVGSRTITQKQLVSSPSLKTLAKSRAGMDLDKNETVRLGFDAFKDPGTPIPENYLIYAAQDALATYLVFKSQSAEARILQEPIACSYPRAADSVAKWGLLSERIQVLGSLGLGWLEQHPLQVDTERAHRVRQALETELLRFESALISFKWAKRGPRSGKFALRFKFLRAVLEQHLRTLPIPATPEFSDTGLLSLNHDFWSKLIPKITKEFHANPERAEKTEDRLSVWLRYTRARKLLQTYIYVYSSSAVHYPRYQNIGARTGRTSSACPNAQNIPKRRDGIRALFVPSPEHVYLEADFNAAELVALAQVYHHLYGGSVLGQTINAGLDPHIETARRIFPAFDRASEKERKDWRQAAKAVNFGLPGGLGAKTFRKYAGSTWGVSLTEEEAIRLRDTAIREDPELRRYLQDLTGPEAKARLVARNLEITLEQLVTACNAWDKRYPTEAVVNTPKLFYTLKSWAMSTDASEGDRPPFPLPPHFNIARDLFRVTTTTLTGRIRGRASFTEARNTPFQGLIADAGKLALWFLYLMWEAGKGLPSGSSFSPVAFVHDSILVECLPEAVPTVTEMLTQAMRTGIRAVCPNIKGDCTVLGPLARWGENTSPWGEEEKEPLNESPQVPARR